jgi:uncharacterized membrane protein
VGEGWGEGNFFKFNKEREMKRNIDKIVKTAMAGVMALCVTDAAMAATATTTSATTPATPATEKCYGIVKAGMNDCQTKTASCAGSATKDKQGDAFLFVPKGTCDKIVGGSLNPIETK